MYIARQIPINPHIPQLELDGAQNIGVMDPIRKQLFIVVVVSAIGLACELISPGALATIASYSDSLSVTG